MVEIRTSEQRGTASTKPAVELKEPLKVKVDEPKKASGALFFGVSLACLAAGAYMVWHQI